MALAQLLLTLCLIADPSTCKTERIILSVPIEELTPYKCMQAGQQETAKLYEVDQKWRLTKWGCGRYRPEADA